MSEKKYKVDLHVHTPASKCYKGVKGDEGYWQILKKAVENDVRMIAITDHNTLSGYEKLMELKQKAIQEYEFAQKYNVSDEDKNKIRDNVELFDKVAIIMGVEITLNPGVHIIVLGGEESKNDIDSLLTSIGYKNENRGCDDLLPDEDIKNFLTNDILSNFIVLAPHVDSAKGIWNVLEGAYRAAIFKSDTITAITCNNDKQLEAIRNLTKNDTNYKRAKPFVCINASDAHEQTTIGEKHSYGNL